MRIVRAAVALLIASFFALMWGLVLRERIDLARAVPLAQGYDALLAPDEESRRIVMGIYLGKMRLGATTTNIERRAEGGISVVSKTHLALREAAKGLGFAAQDIEMEFEADISPLTGLRSFRVRSDAFGLRLVGAVQGEELLIRGQFGGRPFETSIDTWEKLVLSDPLSPMSGPSDLSADRLGDAWAMHVVNPFLQEVERVTVRLSSYRDIEVGGEQVRVFKLTFHARGRRWHAWLDEGGDVILQSTPLPLGIMLVREDLPPELIDALMAPDPETTAP